MEFLLNILFAVLAFFVVRYVGLMIAPEGADVPKVVTVIAVIVAIVVFFADFGDKVL